MEGRIDRDQVVALVILLGGAIMFGVLSFMTLSTYTATAEAQVTGDIGVFCQGESCPYVADVTFSTGSGQWTTTEIELPRGVTTGDQLPVAYDPDDPTDAVKTSTLWFAYGGGAITIGMLAAAVGLIRKVWTRY